MEYFKLSYPIPENLSSKLCGVIADMAAAPGIQFDIQGTKYTVKSCVTIDLVLFIRSGRVKISRNGWVIPTSSKINDFLLKIGYPSTYLFIRSQFNDCRICDLEAHKVVHLINFKDSDPFVENWL